jgi:hypothetical protein
LTSLSDGQSSLGYSNKHSKSYGSSKAENPSGRTGGRLRNIEPTPSVLVVEKDPRFQRDDFRNMQGLDLEKG